MKHNCIFPKQSVRPNINMAIIGLTLLFLSCIFVFVVKYFGLGPDEWRHVRVQVMGKSWIDATGSTNYRPQLYLKNPIRIGDNEYGADGRIVASVMETNMFDSGDGLSVTLILKLKVNTNKRTKILQYRNMPLENGALLQLSLANTKVSAQVIDVDYPMEGYVSGNLKIIGRYRNIEPWLLSSIKTGDTMRDLASGNAIATITKVTIEPSLSQIYYTGVNYFTNTFLEKNPRLQDAVIGLDIKTIKINDIWFFAGEQKVKVGQPLRIRLPEYELGYVEVQEIQTID